MPWKPSVRCLSSRPFPRLKESSRRRSLPAEALVLLLTLVPGVVASAPSGAAGSTAEPQIQRGERLYRIHCLNCHGEGGHGDGPVAEVLTTEIPDLTRLAKRHRGTFPWDEVTAAIDGRYQIEGHGLREMPVWGLSFQERGRDVAQEVEVQQRLLDLTAYLASLQEGAEER